ncbi:uncharacterized protein LOC131057333 isoform X2 [Cryptomeria japonica]|uniref:uncharacterized protein LOC131057333 isoform X2 n=1 Tax=Cryptomeria japonica TaxID=3369 RepID=UPI0025AC618E|nr:uncharacterized protein LOC131057333 isoform X2 [Cryptomeria japonica]
METLGEVNEKTIEYTEGFVDERKWYEKRIEELMCAVEEMKFKRVEDMKANERVLAIFASKEEAWKKERRQLMQELDALREIEKSSNIREIENFNYGSCSDENNSRKENSQAGCSTQTGCNNPSIDELMQKLGKEAEERKLAYKRFVSVVSEMKAQKKKSEDKLRNAIFEMGASKREAAVKAKEKKHVDAALRKVTDEILRLQKEVDDKDSIIKQLCHRKETVIGVTEILEAELRAKELELSNAKNMLKEYADVERNREREVDKWKRLYLGIKRELDNLHIGTRQSSGLLENGHSSAGRTI